MTYVMSDLHGCSEAYRQMLEQIGFSSDDRLFVLGDVIDRGDRPLSVLMDLYGRENATLLLGNHEYMARWVLRNSNNRSPLYERKRDHWYMNGGEVTHRQFFLLPEGDRALLCDYLESLPTYKVLPVEDKTFVLVHAGLAPLSSPGKLSSVAEHDLVWLRPDPTVPVFEDESVYVVFGHTPTKLFSGRWEIFHRSRNICVDCGAAYGGRLACLRLEDMQEFYL